MIVRPITRYGHNYSPIRLTPYKAAIQRYFFDTEIVLPQ